ncbi:protein kinase [Klebsormidium nitens]|uniref:Protein kinase n=1 Tax=Klebsormidium nitens TaxID=105231 RepID=A0A1Y1ILH6_KLENI|nr:protein kinase [Klebsormidium nitens]|eukprot:GAQ90299.1 protein kinase [Klebsormidium nitens]
MLGHARRWMTIAILVTGLAIGACGDTLPADVRALQGLLSELGAPVTLAGSWQGQDPCATKWRGIVCDMGSPQKVVTLDLSGLRLYGAIPPSVGLLVNLQNLYLARNGFSRSIPVAVGSLGQLQSFDVSNNSLSGTVPAILAALPLTALYLQGNSFLPPLPAELNRILTLKVDPYLLSAAPAPAPAEAEPLYAPNPIPNLGAPNPFPFLGNQPNSRDPVLATNGSQTGGPLVGVPSTTPNASAGGCTEGPWTCFCNGGLPGQQQCNGTRGSFEPCNCTATTCMACPAGTVVRPTQGPACDCVAALLLQLKLHNATLSAFTTADESAFLTNLAATLGVQPQQLTVSLREAGSVILTVLLTPLTGLALPTSAAATVRTTLGAVGSDPVYGPYDVMLVQDQGSSARAVSPSAALVAGGHSFAKTTPFWIGMLVLNAAAIASVVGALLYCRHRRGKKGKQLTSFRHFVHHQHSVSAEKPTHSVSPAESAVDPSLNFSFGLRRGLSGVPHDEGGPDIVARYFSFDELHQATGGFDALHRIGHGGSSIVYRGKLKDGRTVAVKQLSVSSLAGVGDREFLLEVALLSRLHHCHLVQLVGYCGDAHERLLVYEYMPAGTLREHLNAPNGRVLDWPTRLQIALGAARGLEYLHEAANPRVIHRDFKSSNILLDKKLRAKVSDFGMAKQMAEGSPLASPHLTQVLGTFGYFAPEYAMMGRATTKSDIFSFGVVLLELISGRAPVDMSRPRGQESLVLWASPLLHDEQRVLAEVADPGLAGRFSPQDLQRLALLALACLQPDPEQRPRMPAVVQSIQTLLPENQPARSGPSSWAREVSDRLTQSFDPPASRRSSWGKRGMARPLVSGASASTSSHSSASPSQTSDQKSTSSIGEAIRKTWVEVTSKLKPEDGSQA